jgi:hypothetical protein
VHDATPTDVAESLRGFLRGDLSFDQLRSRLADFVQIHGDAESLQLRYPKPLGIQIQLSPNDLLPVLERYWAYDLDDRDLARWAAILVTMSEYTGPLSLTEAEADLLLEPMWDVLWDLSAPSLLGMPLRERVAAALRELPVVQARLPRRAG